jgi:hypothetical protein
MRKDEHTWQVFTESQPDAEGHNTILWFWRCVRADGSEVTSDYGFASRIACEQDARKHGCVADTSLIARPADRV